MARIVFVLTYPAYHGLSGSTEWLSWDNRDSRLPALLASMGADVEFWAVGEETRTLLSDPRRGTPYPVRLFAADDRRGRSRDHVSSALNAAARDDPADLFVLIGVDGGVGYKLYDQVLRPRTRRYAIILGGGHWSRLVPRAAFIFLESPVQGRRLTRPPFWRRAYPAARTQLVGQIIDFDVWKPIAAEPTYDLIAASRLVPYKSFDEIGRLSPRFRVAVAGDGPQRDALRARYPHIAWLGQVDRAEMPALLARARVFFHAGRRDYLPRAIIEAMACGKPVVGFRGSFDDYAIPERCGLLVEDRDYAARVAELLADPERIERMGQAARDHVIAAHGPATSRAVCATLMRLAERGA
ncbi:glycosyltransferase [Sphingomonas sp. BK235]|uniref:glycosyltransferase n=1 Tax=Sphingomonas sp. BK235 TaxID=2512131 RepID=UPI00104406F4|nr:glycosyltransferase [Sphingomonas sp. BK235]TCP35830.1 glycosyl transferase family 1 [Sphingomonas sp. BK235]